MWLYIFWTSLAGLSLHLISLMSTDGFSFLDSEQRIVASKVIKRYAGGNISKIHILI